jgi:peptidoglycan/xylan/chitin deacetylase (PgdA/CDA1 family)
MKRKLKVLIGLLAGWSAIHRVFRFFQRKKLVILYYHRVAKKEEVKNTEDINMYTDIDNFCDQMRFLKENCHPVSEEEVSIFLKAGGFPDYPVWVTFDDGWKDNYTNALPILKKYSIPATFFVTTGYVNKTVMPEKTFDNDAFMNWQEIKEVSEAGISIGAHTVSHRILSGLSGKELEEEIIESKNEIEQRLGKRVISFAYPAGRRRHYCLEKCAPILKKNNFELAVNTIGGFNAPGSGNELYDLNRMGSSYEDMLELFKFKISLSSFWQR